MKKTIVLAVAAMFLNLNVNAQDVKKDCCKDKAKTENCSKCAKKDGATDKTCCGAGACKQTESKSDATKECCKKKASECKKANEKAGDKAQNGACCKLKKAEKQKKSK